MNPYVNLNVSKDRIDRSFKSDTDAENLVWHRDLEDRILYPISPTDWMIQIEDELPKKIEAGIMISAGVWHRLIKGTGDLNVTIQINNIEDAQSLHI